MHDRPTYPTPPFYCGLSGCMQGERKEEKDLLCFKLRNNPRLVFTLPLPPLPHSFEVCQSACWVKCLCQIPSPPRIRPSVEVDSAAARRASPCLIVPGRIEDGYAVAGWQGLAECDGQLAHLT